MHLLTIVSVYLSLALTAVAANIPTTAVLIADSPAGVVVTPTTAQEPDLISPNMAPIVSGPAPTPQVPPPDAWGQAVQMSFIGSTWILSNACHSFTEKGDIPAPVVEFINEGYTNCKSCAFWYRSDCVGEVAWKGKVPGSPFTLKFPLGNRPYSYECLDFDSNWP